MEKRKHNILFVPSVGSFILSNIMIVRRRISWTGINRKRLSSINSSSNNNRASSSISKFSVIILVWWCCSIFVVVTFDYDALRTPWYYSNFFGVVSAIRCYPTTNPATIKRTIIGHPRISRMGSSTTIWTTKNGNINDENSYIGDSSSTSIEDSQQILDHSSDHNINNSEGKMNNKEDMVNVQKRAMTFKRRMKALSTKFLDDNGLELVMERKTGIITARPKKTTTANFSSPSTTPTSAQLTSSSSSSSSDTSSINQSTIHTTSSTNTDTTTILDDFYHDSGNKNNKKKAPLKTISAKYLDDNGLELVRDIETGAISAQPVGRYLVEDDGNNNNTNYEKYKPIVFSLDKHNQQETTTQNDVDTSTLYKNEDEMLPSSTSSLTLKESISNSLSSSKRKGIERAIEKEKTKKSERDYASTDTITSNTVEERSTKKKNQKKKPTNVITKMPKIIDNSAKRAAARAALSSVQQQKVGSGLGSERVLGFVNEEGSEFTSISNDIFDQTQQSEEHQYTASTTINKPKITSTRLREKYKRKTKAGIAVVTPLKEHTPKVNDVINPTKQAFNVVLTHCTADFDSLASAVGLAKLWSSEQGSQLLDMTSIKAPSSLNPNGSSSSGQDTLDHEEEQEQQQDAIMSSDVPTYVVLPRGAHPGVARFLGLHKHLFPIRSLKSLPHDLSSLNRLGLVDAQRRDRVGPAAPLLGMAKRVTILDHHIDGESDIPEASDYVVEQVGSVSTMVVERIQRANVELSEAEATLLALGIHADTGSLCFDSTTPRDAMALAYCMQAGASQPAIAEHAQSSLSEEQNSVLTQALLNTNSTLVHGVTVTTVLLSSEGFINGLAAVAQDVLELTSSGVLIFAVVYDPKARNNRSSSSSSSSSSSKKKLSKKNQSNNNNNNKNSLASAAIVNDIEPSQHPSSQQLRHTFAKQQQQAPAFVPGSTAASDVSDKIKHNLESAHDHGTTVSNDEIIMFTEAWKGGEQALKKRRLQAAFAKKDIDNSGYLERQELSAALSASGVIASKDTLDEIIVEIDSDGDGKVNFDEFEAFAELVEERQKQLEKVSGKRSSTMIIIGRVKTGINVKSVNLNTLFQPYGGGGHAKAASATVRLEDSSEAEGILQRLVDELIETSLLEQPTVGEFMTSPVLSAKPTMTETQVEDLFSRYDVRALPVVDEDNNVIGLVTYKEVAAAKQRLWNKQQKHLERERKEKEKEQQQRKDADGTNHHEGKQEADNDVDEQEKRQREKIRRERRQSLGSALKGWMKQHVRVVEASTTLTEAEEMLLENDVGCIPVVADGTKQLVGMVTRTDILRQHRYYPSLHYHNKGFSDSIEARKPIIELRKRLKKFDLENE